MKITFEEFRKEIISDYKMGYRSRYLSSLYDIKSMLSNEHGSIWPLGFELSFLAMEKNMMIEDALIDDIGIIFGIERTFSSLPGIPFINDAFQPANSGISIIVLRELIPYKKVLRLYETANQLNLPFLIVILTNSRRNLITGNSIEEKFIEKLTGAISAQSDFEPANTADYPNLCSTFQKKIEFCREQRKSAIVYVKNSDDVTNGMLDELLEFRQWIIHNKLSLPVEIEATEREASSEASDIKRSIIRQLLNICSTQL